MRSLGLLTFMIPVGFSAACSILVGQNIGKGCVDSIKYYFKMSMYLAFFVGLAQVAVMAPLQEEIASGFTDQADVIATIGQAWWIFMFFIIFDTTQGIAMSAIRASGKQKIGAIVTFISYWIVGIPITTSSVFKADQGIAGIWYGPTVAVFINTLVYVAIFYKMDWDMLILKAAEQREMDKQSKQLSTIDALGIEPDNDEEETADDNFQKQSNTIQ